MVSEGEAMKIDRTLPRFHRTGVSWFTGLVEFCLAIPEHLRAMPMIEIGSYAGESAEIFANLFTGDIYCIDIWDKVAYNDPEGLVEDTFNKRMIQWYPRIHKFQCTSEKASELFKAKQFGVVYIDAMHDYANVCMDIGLWLPKVIDGGIISGHDFDATDTGDPYVKNENRENHLDVVNAVGATLGNPDRVFCDGSWLKNVGKI